MAADEVDEEPNECPNEFVPESNGSERFLNFRQVRYESLDKVERR